MEIFTIDSLITVAIASAGTLLVYFIKNYFQNKALKKQKILQAITSQREEVIHRVQALLKSYIMCNKALMQQQVKETIHFMETHGHHMLDYSDTLKMYMYLSKVLHEVHLAPCFYEGPGLIDDPRFLREQNKASQWLNQQVNLFLNTSAYYKEQLVRFDFDIN